MNTIFIKHLRIIFRILPFSASHFSTSLSRSSQHNPFRSSTGRVPSESLLLQVPSQSPSSVSPSPFRQAWRLLDSRLSTLMAAKIRFEARDRYRPHVSEEREFRNCSLGLYTLELFTFIEKKYIRESFKFIFIKIHCICTFISM